MTLDLPSLTRWTPRRLTVQIAPCGRIWYDDRWFSEIHPPVPTTGPGTAADVARSRTAGKKSANASGDGVAQLPAPAHTRNVRDLLGPTEIIASWPCKCRS